MIQFMIKKDQIPRLKTELDYIKKMEAFSPLAEKQIFILNQNKLNIYGIADSAGAGHIEASFDVNSKDDSSFSLELSKFITYLEKTKSDEINISIDKDKMTVKSKTSSIVINQALITSSLDETALEEIKEFIATTLALQEFKKPIDVKLDYKNLITDLGTITKLQDTNHQILVGKKNIKVADNLCIISVKPKVQSTTEDIYIDRDIMSLFKSVDTFKVSSDKKYFYFDIANYGIKLLFVPKTFNWQFPEDKELAEISPIDTKQIIVEIDTKKFYEVISEFNGVFDAASWRFEQIYFKTPKNFKKNNQLDLYFDNMDVEIKTSLPVTIKSDTDGTDDFSFMLPTQHFKLLENILLKYDTFDMKYSSTSIDKPNGISIVIENPEASIIIAKMIP